MAYKKMKSGMKMHSQEKASKSMGKAGGWPLSGKGKSSYCPNMVIKGKMKK